jgi:hypothetical protein
MERSTNPLALREQPVPFDTRLYRNVHNFWERDMHLPRPSPSGVIASLALFFALGGTAMAAHHYLLTSTSQIKPSVLKALKSANGTAGAKGAAGAAGPAGEKGSPGSGGSTGQQGPAGASGTGVVARVRSATAVATTSTPELTPTFVSDPLAGATWTQHAGELNQLAGQVTITFPSEAACGSASPVAVEILLDGRVVGGASASNAEEAEKTETVPLGWAKGGPGAGPFSTWGENTSPWLYEPGTDTAHTLTAQVADTCTNPAHPTIKSVSVDVLGAS